MSSPDATGESKADAGVVELVIDPGADEQGRILAVLSAYNDAVAGPTERKPLAVVVRDDAGIVVGGLWGVSSYRWLFIQYLALPPALRGQGTGCALMLAAEAEAVARGCVGVWLDTFSFQARGFYEKLGYSVFGRIDDYPPGEARFFLCKRIAGG